MTELTLRRVRLPRLAAVGEWEGVWGEPWLLLFKHSDACPTSHAARRQVALFHAAHPDAPLYLVRVRQDRPLSDEVTRRTGVRHESPQVILLRHGRVAATASHGAITGEWLRGLLPG